MRILQIVPSISLVYGGPSQMVLGLSAALARQGVEVTILTTDSNGDVDQSPLDVPLNCPIEQDGYQIIYFRCSPFRRYKFSLGLLRWLFKHAQEFDLAHIHALFSPVSSAAASVARYRHLPYLMRPLGTLDPADLYKKRRAKQIYAALWERANLAGASGIHFTTVQEAKISERFGTSVPDVVIPLGVQPPPITLASGEVMPTKGRARTQLGIDSESSLILFMSRIDPKKGLNLLIPALEKLLAEGLNFHFVMAGGNPQDPEYEKQIQQQLRSSPICSHTTITGFVGGDFKVSLLQDADLFVLPSYYENFGIAVAEAMYYAVPVVISEQVYIWEEIQAAAAGWVCSCEVESLTEMLRLALRDSRVRQQRGLNAQEYALKNYSWDAIALATIKVYHQILKNPVPT